MKISLDLSMSAICSHVEHHRSTQKSLGSCSLETSHRATEGGDRIITLTSWLQCTNVIPHEAAPKIRALLDIFHQMPD